MNVTEEENGNAQGTHRPTLLADLAGVLEDHVNLAALEAQFEIRQTQRRVLVFIIAGIFGLSAFLLGQVAIVDGLVALLKLPVWAVCLILTGVYGALSALILNRYGQRDHRVGAPFSGTRRELIETLQWMQKLFS